MWLLVVLLIAGTDPRAKVTDYPSHAESAKVAIGAEYLVHSFSNGSQMYFTPDYLVVDTAVYPRGAMAAERSKFSLRLTFVKSSAVTTLRPETPQMVGYSIVGAINSVPPEFRGKAAKDPGESVDAVVGRMALPEDVTKVPESGYLYFAFSGKTKKIQSMELVYSDAGDELVVKLF